MREIELKVWNDKDKRMETVIGITWKDGQIHQIATKEFEEENGQLMYYSHSFTNRFLIPIQYIGIIDIHKKKVFQGYIVKVKETIYTDCDRDEIEEIREFTGEIVWLQYGWHVAEKIENGIRYHALWLWNIEGEEDDTMEIIGNIYENPEMRVVK